MKTEMKPIFDRIISAKETFCGNVMEQFELDLGQAEKVFQVFGKAKAIKLDLAIGRYNLIHGAFWGKDVILRALSTKEVLPKDSK